MRVLVLTQAYPSETQPYNLAYVHARVLRYLQAGWQVSVLSFSCTEAYQHEGVTVLPERELLARGQRYDVLISHAPNLRNHVRFMQQQQRRWRRMVWVIHGHEVLIKQNYYPAPFAYDRRATAPMRLLDRSYDELKVRLLARLMRSWIQQQKLSLICVSEWMKQALLESVPIDPQLLDPVTTIAPNPIHPGFLKRSYTPADILADYVTIRPLDEPKYAVDVVAELATRNPQLRFDVYGRGHYFEHFPPPHNLHWQERFFTQAELPDLLNHYRGALMPTRLDAQGVMNCEIASYGMPLVTNDLPVCVEMLSDFPCVSFFNLENPQVDLFAALNLPIQPNKQRFSDENTIGVEIRAIEASAPSSLL